MVRLTPAEQAATEGGAGPAQAMAMRVVAEAARLLGAGQLIKIASAHIDSCLYHGESGVAFAERLVAGGGRVCVPATLNAGVLDLCQPGRVRADAHLLDMGHRLQRAYAALGCRPSWTCAPYQAGHRPDFGQHVAWGESNAVAFCNSVLGARTDRYGDFLDICCALTGRAPAAGLHLDDNRRARALVDATGLSPRLRRLDAFYPVLGAWLGAAMGSTVAVIDGLPADVGEDQLKALGAAAAATGAVGLFHVAGATPEAPTAQAALGDRPPETVVRLTAEMVRQARDRLSTCRAAAIDCVALGSPHFSLHEFDSLERLLGAGRTVVPIYVCTGRHVMDELRRRDRLAGLTAAGVELVVDTCVVIAPVLPAGGGVLMTNAAKFAHYAPANIGYDVVYGSLADCVASAAAGRVIRDEGQWQ